MDLKMDMQGTKDLIFVNGSCPVTESFVESTAQRVFVMLRTFQQEWYLNTTTGIPYIPNILGSKSRKGTIDRIMQEKILQEEGVAEILSFTSFIDGRRSYSASFVVRTTTGDTFDDEITLTEI